MFKGNLKGEQGMEKYPITSKFSSKESFREHAHNGIDFAMEKNTELRSIKEGIVDRVVYQPNGIGKAVYIKWEDNKTALYGHMNKITVKKGDKVNTGDLLGYSGNTGNVVGENGGYHLHFGLKDENGSFINPEEYIPYIQKMNSDLIPNMPEPSIYSPETIFNTAMENFSDSLLNTFSLLVDNPELIQGFQYLI